MKKKILIILAVILVVIIASGAYFYVITRPVVMTKVLPANPLVYLEIADTLEIVKAIQSTAFWRNISSLDYEAITKKMGVSFQQRQGMKAVITQLSDPATENFIKKFLGQDVVLAIYPPSINAVSVHPTNLAAMAQIAFSGVFLVTRIQGDVQAAEFIASAFGLPAGTNLPIEEVSYQGYKIHTIMVSSLGVKLAFVRIRDLLIVGVGEEPARRSIDAFKNKNLALFKDFDFQKTKKHSLEKANLFAYLNLEKVLGLISEQSKNLAALAGPNKNIAPVSQQWEGIIKALAGFKSINTSAEWGSVFKMKFDIAFDKKAMDPSLASSYAACLPMENQSIHFVPKDILVSQWNSCFDLKYLWEIAKTELVRVPLGDKAPSVDEQVKQIEKQLGMKIEDDILASFGTEMGGYLKSVTLTKDVSTLGSFPIPVPQFLIFTKVADRNKMDNLLMKITVNQPRFALQAEDYATVPIHYMNLSGLKDTQAENFEPAYCYLGDYLLIAMNRLMLREAIDLNHKTQGSPTLLTNADFQSVNLGLTEKNTDVTYVQFNQVIAKIKEMLILVNDWADQGDKKKLAFKTGSEKRLADIKNELPGREQELKGLQEKIEYYQKEVDRIKAKSLDFAAQEKTLEQSIDDKNGKEKEIASLKEQLEQTKKVTGVYSDQLKFSQERHFYFSKLINPFLDGLQDIKAVGLRMTTVDDVVESTLIVK